MLRVLSPTYQLRITIKDEYKSSANSIAGINAVGQSDLPPSHKFFDSIKGKSGCDEALAAVKDALAKAGIEATVWLEQFSHT